MLGLLSVSDPTSVMLFVLEFASLFSSVTSPTSAMPVESSTGRNPQSSRPSTSELNQPRRPQSGGCESIHSRLS